MKNAVIAARILLGLPFVVFGLNFYLEFMEQPDAPEKAGAFLGALAGSGYVFEVIKPLEILCGLMLISGQWVPLALVLLAPITVNIVGYHVKLDPGQGLWIALALAALHVFLILAYMKEYRSLLLRVPEVKGS